MENRFKHAVCWLRRDLRLTDHRTLFEACRQAQKVSLVFVFDRVILDALEVPSDRRISFIFWAIEKLILELRHRGTSLILRYGDPTEEIPKVLLALGADALFFCRDYEPYATKRDTRVTRAAEKLGIRVFPVKDQVIFEGLEISKPDGSAYCVYSAYRKKWLGALGQTDLADSHPNLRQISWSQQEIVCDQGLSWTKLGFKKGDFPCDSADREYARFFKKISRYHLDRNLPACNGTSRLSTHLRFGTLSVRRLVRKAKEIDGPGAEAWISELIWRDFFQMVLWLNPRVVHEAFNSRYAIRKWPGRKSHFEAWCQGRTGYPIVDAAMRSFDRTGWMHNRLRMIVASFLIKDLLIDWRTGERWFAKHLIDYDLAANNGNWQWVASTGCDAQPYFRIFNPVLQSRRYDPAGEFIRSELPELAGFSDRYVHLPFLAPRSEQLKAGCVIGRNYPFPIVNHTDQVQQALSLYGR